MSRNSVELALEIKTTSGSVLKPQELHVWDLSSKTAPQRLSQVKIEAPFKFYTDAIVALCFHRMSDFKNVAAEHKNFVVSAYDYFDHYTELYKKSQTRVKSLSNRNLQHQKLHETFEKKTLEIFNAAFSKSSVSFNELTAVLNHISDFESKIGSPLIYNFGVQFTAEFTEKLICFYSFLYHLRSLIAIDHNAHVEDSSHETVKCDSISDYLPKSDYTVNDALLYWHFKQLASPFVGDVSKTKTVGVEKNLVTPMLGYFQQYSHNACCLVDQLPVHFLKSLKEADLEEALHHVQMDWLLGSSSGLLFKIREELFGVIEGYDKIFWPEASEQKSKKASHLNLCFSISEKDIAKQKAA